MKEWITSFSPWIYEYYEWFHALLQMMKIISHDSVYFCFRPNYIITTHSRYILLVLYNWMGLVLYNWMGRQSFNNTLSFYGSQYVLCWANNFVWDQKLNYTWCRSKKCWAFTKTESTKIKSSFGLAQKVWDWHNIYIFFSGEEQKNWFTPKDLMPCPFTRSQNVLCRSKYNPI